MDRQTPGAEGAPDRAQKGVVAYVAGRKTGLTPCVDKAQPHGLRGHLRRNRGLQQIGMKRQHVHAVAGGALGEHGQHITGTQSLGHVVHHAQGVAGAGALDIQSTRRRRERADERPGFQLRLGHKAAILRRMQNHDVQPRNMVGHQQHRPGLGRCVQHQPDVHDAQDILRPALHRCALLDHGHAGEAGIQSP